MGQYFKLINLTKHEFVELPGPMKAIERITNPVAMGMFGYLMLEGPLDGTSFVYEADPDDPKLENKIQRRKNKAESEKEKYFFERYMNDDGSWNEQVIAQHVAASEAIADMKEYAGRWAGDNVSLVGDYSETGHYNTANEIWTYDYGGTLFNAPATSVGPIKEDSIERDDIDHTFEIRDIEEGDWVEVVHPEKGERVYALFVGVAESKWTDITDGLTDEFIDFVGDGWVDQYTDVSKLRPDVTA